MCSESAKDRTLAALAGAQHGVVSRAQLLTLGFTTRRVDHRVRTGRLHLLHRGVYAVGHRALRLEGRWMAAAMATNAVLSHQTAAAAWDLRRLGSGAIHVTVPGWPGRKRRAGIRVHRSTTLTPDQTTTHRGIPITTPTRTLIDLAATLKGRPLEQALDRAELLRLVDFAELERTLANHPGRPGSPSLHAQLSRYTAGTTITRSELEEQFLALCDDHGIRRPETNISIEGEEVDFAWRDAKLIVEVDGYAYHRSPTAFEEDRERDVTLTVAGWRVMRFTYGQITRRPRWVAAAMREGGVANRTEAWEPARWSGSGGAGTLGSVWP